MGVDVLDKAKADIDISRRHVIFQGKFCVELDIAAGEVTIVEDVQYSQTRANRTPNVELSTNKEEQPKDDIPELIPEEDEEEDDPEESLARYSFNPECYKITADQEYIIPARSMSLIQTKIPKEQRDNMGRNGPAMINGTEQPESNNTSRGLLITDMIIGLEEDNFPTNVVNFTDEAIIRRG